MNNNLNNNIGSENSQLSNNQPTEPVTNDAPTMQPNPIPNSNEFNQQLGNNNINSNEPIEQPSYFQNQSAPMQQPINSQMGEPESSNEMGPQTSSPQFQSTPPISKPVYENPINNTKPSKNKNVLIIAIIIIIIGLVVGVFFFIKGNSNKTNKNNDHSILPSSDSFSVYNKAGEYTIFNIDGEQLANVNFKSVSSFVNGTARVTNLEEQSGVIKSDGKMLFDFGECKYLFDEGPFYNCVDENYDDNIYTTTKKLVIKGESLDFVTTHDEEYCIIQNKDTEKYILYDYKGNVLLSFDDLDNGSVPSTSQYDEYTHLFYNNINYYFDITKSKLVLSFSDENSYSIDEINENDRNEFILSSGNNYKFVKNGKIQFTKTSNSMDALHYEGDNLVLNDGIKKQILNDQGNAILELTSDEAYIDTNNYLRDADIGVDVYVNNQFKTNYHCFKDSNENFAVQGIYLLRSCTDYDRKKIYIKSDGTRLDDKAYELAYPFDENGYAVVSDDEENFYVINLKGEKVSDYYVNNRSAYKIYNIEGTNNIYYGDNADGTRTIFEINGKKLYTTKWFETKTVNGTKYIFIEKDGKYTLYDFKSGKEIVTINEQPYLREQHFEVGSKYYSYTTGKMFFEYK